MDTNRASRGATRRTRPAVRARFSRDQIEEIKTTGRLVLYIVASALLVIGCYFWLAGIIPGSPDKSVTNAPAAVPEVGAPGQADSEAVLRARAQRSCDEGNQDACMLLGQPTPLNTDSDPPVAARKEP